MIDNTCKIELEQQWREKFPSTLSSLFSFYQCLCTIAIIGCEVGSILIDLFNATIYVGFWASLVFMIAWISQAVAVSCHRTRKCATYTLIIQCITLFFAVCVIGFDAYFLIQPTTCFFPLTLCKSEVPLRGLFYSEDYFNNIKIPLIKGQLATATIMFAFCLDYIIIYIVTRIRMKNNTKSILQTSTNPIDILNTIDNTINTSLPTTDRNISTSVDLTFERSWNKSTHNSRWSMNSFDINPIKI